MWWVPSGSSKLSTCPQHHRWPAGTGEPWALPGLARLCGTVPGSVNRRWDFESDTSPQGALITHSTAIGLEVIYFKKQELDADQICIYSHRIHPMLAVLDLKIHLRGQKQMRWAKSQRDVRNTPFSHQGLHLLFQKKIVSGAVSPNYFPLKLLCIYLNKTTLCK